MKTIKIWQYNGVDLFLFHTGECTQKYVEDNYTLIAQTTEDLKEWFKNFSLKGKLYDVCSITSYKDTDYKTKNVFAKEYQVKTLKEIKLNPQIENLNNAICPVCGYVDYYCWENITPDEDYKCPQCKSSLLLEHKYVGDYDENLTLYQRTTFKKLHRPPRIKQFKGGE